jgi:phosphoglycolate phosphatase-like HAD superfamily hydrolase
MINELLKFLPRKKYFIFDFDRTLAKMEIDWTDWHLGIAQIYSKYNPDHGYEKGKNPHQYHNILVERYGDPLLAEARQFNRDYESKHLTGFTPNIELIKFIHDNTYLTFYVYSSNARSTVVRGLTEVGILDRIKKVVTKDDVRFVKPNPEGFTLLDDFKGNEPQFLMIGDSGADRDAAKAAGIDFLECSNFEKYTEEQ